MLFLCFFFTFLDFSLCIYIFSFFFSVGVRFFLFPADYINFVVFCHYCQRFPLHVVAISRKINNEPKIQKKRTFLIQCNNVAVVIKCDVLLTQFALATQQLHIFYGWRNSHTIQNILGCWFDKTTISCSPFLKSPNQLSVFKTRLHIEWPYFKFNCYQRLLTNIEWLLVID